MAEAEAKQEESPSFKITYFGIPGRGAPLRAAAFIGGLSYEDYFQSGAEHGQVKAQGGRRWTGIPELTLYDKDGNTVAVIGQSNVCLGLIGKLTTPKMFPDNPVQGALVNEIMTGCEDMVGAVLGPTFGKKDDELKKARAEIVSNEKKLSYWFGKFEARLTENEARGCKSGYFVGDTMTVADLKAFYGLNGMAAGNWDFLDVSPILAKMPKITAFLKMMNEDEGIKKFNAAFKAQMEKTKADAKDNVHIIKGKNVYVSL